MSPKQQILIEYLIKQLGFEDDNFLKQYIDELEKTIPVFTPDRGPDFVMENIIDLLFLELNTMKNRRLESRLIGDFISATDIAAFTYCPVSYAIAKSFVLPKPESAIIGTSLHSKGYILNFTGNNNTLGNEQNSNQHNKKANLDYLINEENELLFDTLKKSELVYADFDGSGKPFKGKRGAFVGKPDYIFRDEVGNFFAVEEKYQYRQYSSSISPNFYDNHVNQIVSYIYGIPKPKIAYGFLVYWKYDFHNNDIYIQECQVKKINKTALNRQNILTVFRAIEHFMNEKLINFDKSSRNPKKCANCVYRLYCGHKTGYFTKIPLPYPPDVASRIKSVKLPKVLEVKNIGHNYNFIQMDVKKTWLCDKNRIFLFKLGDQERFEEVVIANYHQIEDFEKVYGVKFITHKKIVQIANLSKAEHQRDAFIDRTSIMEERLYYEELARQSFSGKDIIDPVYILRQYDDFRIIFWGAESFRKEGKIVFPFECLLPLNNIIMNKDSKFCFIST
ncbi:hypothetical protein SAMN05660226_01990 [Parapedobacter luteus]|uniref:PD-(D/E)XK nuclease superfamily protein n=1 Tax=Parapedobacter luteus TaxID=623280 RepID=A0A1T5C978_9SPHI|nr:hypothetical protein [Parapedobacter luteus]SKB56122.1 hypothetical protein SAMN05660226_01990 [Parapedobacter luteus]